MRQECWESSGVVGVKRLGQSQRTQGGEQILEEGTACHGKVEWVGVAKSLEGSNRIVLHKGGYRCRDMHGVGANVFKGMS